MPLLRKYFPQKKLSPQKLEDLNSEWAHYFWFWKNKHDLDPKLPVWMPEELMDEWKADWKI